MPTLPKASATPRTLTSTIGSTTPGPFSLGFRLFDTDGLEVYVNDVARTDYTISATFSGGYTDSATITFDVDLYAGDELVVHGKMAADREEDLLPGSSSLIAKVNIELARHAAMIQENQRDVARSLKVISGDAGAIPVENSSFIGFNSSGTLQTFGGASNVPVSSAMMPVVEASTLQAARREMKVDYIVADFTELDGRDDVEVGDTILVTSGYNGPEIVEIKAAATYTANSQEVYDLTASGLQAVSTRMWFKTEADRQTDTRTFGAGAIVSVAGGEAFTAVASGGDAGRDNAAGQSFTRIDVTGVPPIGAITLPSTFNDTLGVSLSWNGFRVVYDTDPYDLIDFELTDTVNDYYVNYTEGDDANAGTSSGVGNSWKTLDHAVANATSPAVIHLEDDLIGYLSSGSSPKTFTGKIKLKGEGASGRTIIAAMRESYDVASFSWSASGSDGAYVSTTASAKQYRSMLDGNFRNARGIPRPMSAAVDQATCESTPGTFFYDSGTTYLYVHMFDGRTPDPADGWLYGESPYDFEAQQGGTSSSDIWLVENCEFISNNGALSAGAAFRYRPVTTGSETSARVGLKNCLTYGGHDNGFEIYDADVVVTQNCHAWYNRTDGLNYHSFVSTGTKGEYMTVYEHDCTAMYNGWDGWDDQQSLSSSANGSTSHDSMHILRTNTVAGECNGAVIADVNGVHSLNYNVRGTQPNARFTASPNAIFWHEKYLGAGTTKIMYMWACGVLDTAADTGSDHISTTAQGGGASNNGDVRVAYWRGPLLFADGTVSDWAGNALSAA